MQNKGIVKIFAVLLTLVCAFYLSFSLVTTHYAKKAKEYSIVVADREMANQESFTMVPGKMDSIKNALRDKAYNDYMDSLSSKKVFLGYYTLRDCREMEIGLGLDLKGGMNEILEVSVADVIKALADHKSDDAFNQALATASKLQVTSQDDFVTLFIREYHRLAPNSKLSELFATQKLRDKINQRSSDSDVETVLRAEVQSAIDNAYNVLRTRIDRFGVVQPNIQRLEGGQGRIMIELPGIKEPERVRKLLQGSANLEFYETYFGSELAADLQAADARLRLILEQSKAKTTDGQATSASVSTPAAKDSAKTSVDSLLASVTNADAAKTDAASNEQLRKQYPLLSILQVNNSQIAAIGVAQYRDMATINSYLNMPEIKSLFPRELRWKWSVSPTKGTDLYQLYGIKVSDRSGNAPLTGDAIDDATNSFDQMGRPEVSMSMNTEGARKWAQLTKANINRSIAIVLDGYVYSAPNVQNEIPGGRSSITGNFTLEETKDLANVLKSGKMPAPTRIVSEEIIGPSLGQASINAGIVSFVVALILLMIYMCAVYGLIPGLIANGALIFNMFFTLGILASFQAALTMSGIAGMVLTLGMAVDANVLIYERTKEELRAGKVVKKALADGYSNAFSAIFDSNFTSLITGLILFYFGTGPIRGFATTLMIGIVVSFFTAVFMTRVVYEHFMNKDKLLNLTFTSAFSKFLLIEKVYNFIGASKKSFMTYGIIALVCIGSLVIRGMSMSIDFTGGRNYQVQFVNPVQPEQVRSLLAGTFQDANVSVIAIGTDGHKVRISTNYRIDDNDPDVDSEIEATMYNGLKPLLTQNISLETFIDRENRTGGSIISSTKVGPSIADDIKTSALWSVIFSLIAIGLYILLRFRNISFSIGSVVALGADTLFIFGVYSLCWGILPFSLEVDQTFIGAILTAIGYSINDKVVIFDRVREYFHLYPKRNAGMLFNESLNTTLNRTINTSLSTLIVLLCIFFLGGDSIRSFSFAMILGVIFGTLSSVFLASPIAYLLMGKRRHAVAEEESKAK